MPRRLRRDVRNDAAADRLKRKTAEQEGTVFRRREASSTRLRPANPAADLPADHTQTGAEQQQAGGLRNLALAAPTPRARAKRVLAGEARREAGVRREDVCERIEAVGVQTQKRRCTLTRERTAAQGVRELQLRDRASGPVKGCEVVSE